MAVHRSVHRQVLGALLGLLLLPAPFEAKKFREDDPLPREPRPLNVGEIRGRRVSDYYDYFYNTFARPGEHPQKGKIIPARAVNTLGEVPDSPWYQSRHGKTPMTLEELRRGPGIDHAPDLSGPLTVIAAKTVGTTPGFTIRDARGRTYLVKFDPMTNPEITTAADVIVSKFFYALGYNVPENYLIEIEPKQLVVAPDATVRDVQGKKRPMRPRDVTDQLLNVRKAASGRYRAVASLYIPGKLLGEFRYNGMRRDDPNDVVPHEHRRDLRGLQVFCAWLAHEDSRSINTLDTLVEEDGIRYVKHYLVDFGSTLGSQSIGPKSPMWGHEYLFDWGHAMTQLFTLGFAVPRWARARYPKLPSVGRFEAQIFDPETWVPEYHNPAFDNRLPDDTYWAAKQVMAFSDDDIRALVKTGQYSDPRAAQWIADCLMARRDKIGRAYFAKVLPLDRFRVENGVLAFDDLAVKYKFISTRPYTVRWSRFDNSKEALTPLEGESTFQLPALVAQATPGDYFAAAIHGDDTRKTVTVYLHKNPQQLEVVGIDRAW